MTSVEIVATVFGILCVWLTIKQNIWCWPTGLVQVGIYIWIFYSVRLYSDMGLHVIYVVLCIYGWWYWINGGPRNAPPPVTRLTKVALGGWITVGSCGTFALGWSMNRYTDASLPYWDAATTVFSLIAQYLLAGKRLESWWFWIGVDVMAIGIYIAKELYVTSGLYTVFLGMAIAGLLAWRRSLRTTTAVAAGA